MLTVAEALEQIRRCVRPLAARRTPLADALGLRLAEDVTSDVDSPPHDKSVVDGYALRFADLCDGRAELRILEEVTAGEVPRSAVEAGTTTRIMTGAPLPPGADTVVMVEHSSLSGPHVVRLEEAKAKLGQNIVRRATVMRRGDAVLRTGQIIGPAALGLLAEVGRAEVLVVPHPRAAVLATGNELVEPSKTPGPGQIRNSNGPMLAASLRRSGAEPIELGIARDDHADLHAKITAGLQTDLFVLSGGVSAGVLDLVPSVLAELGVREVFHKVTMKPGKPIWFGMCESAAGRTTPVFGLPGNPVSALVCFELFVRRAVVRLSGGDWPGEDRFAAQLAEAFSHRGDRPTFWPGVVETRRSPVAEASVRPLRWQGSGDLRTLVDADCLLCFPAGDRSYTAGEVIDVLPLC